MKTRAPFQRVRTTMFVALLTMACMPDDQRTETLDTDRAEQRREAFPEEGLVQLDGGNEAYSEGDFAKALEHYRQATEVMPDNAAAWFGIAMAATALGDSLAADSAMVKARGLAPGASLIHPNRDDGGTP